MWFKRDRRSKAAQSSGFNSNYLPKPKVLPAVLHTSEYLPASQKRPHADDRSPSPDHSRFRGDSTTEEYFDLGGMWASYELPPLEVDLGDVWDEEALGALDDIEGVSTASGLDRTH